MTEIQGEIVIAELAKIGTMNTIILMVAVLLFAYLVMRMFGGIR